MSEMQVIPRSPIRELAEGLERARSPAEMQNLLDRHLPRIDCRAYYFVTSAGMLPDAQPLVISNLPRAWAARYAARHFHRRDPLVAKARRTGSPFVQFRMPALPDSTRRDDSPGKSDLISEAERGGLFPLLAVPVRGPRGEISLLAVGEHGCLGPGCIANIGRWCAIAERMHENVLSSLPAPGGVGMAHHARLSGRELEVMSWAARGKTSWEVALIIGISAATVNFHVRRSVQKLGASNKCHAVAILAEEGYLDNLELF